MTKFFIKTIFIFIIIFILLLWSGKLLVDKNNIQSFKADELNNIQENVDVAFFGSSHSFSTFDPRLVESELNLSAYNYGGSSENLEVTANVAKQVIKENNLKIGVVDVFSHNLLEPPFSKRIANFQYQTIDHMDFSFEKIELVGRLFGEDNLLHIFPTIRNHVLWKDRLFQLPLYLKDDLNYYKGFRTTNYFNKKTWKKVNKKKKAKLVDDIQLTLGQKKMIDDIIDVFEEKNIPLIFVSAPIFKKSINNDYFTYQQRIKEYLKTKNQIFIDYNQLWYELDLHLYDFRDKSHLNTSGALKVSKHLIKHIKDSLSIEGSGANISENNKHNRFLLMKTQYKDALFYTKIKDTILKNATGVDEVALYQDLYGRLQLLLMGKDIKRIDIKTEYNTPVNETHNLHKNLDKKIKENKYSTKKVLFNLKTGNEFNGLQFNGKEFKFYTIDCPFTEIWDLKINFDHDNHHGQILKIDHLQLQ